VSTSKFVPKPTIELGAPGRARRHDARHRRRIQSDPYSLSRLPWATTSFPRGHRQFELLHRAGGIGTINAISVRPARSGRSPRAPASDAGGRDRGGRKASVGMGAARGPRVRLHGRGLAVRKRAEGAAAGPGRPASGAGSRKALRHRLRDRGAGGAGRPERARWARRACTALGSWTVARTRSCGGGLLGGSCGCLGRPASECGRLCRDDGGRDGAITRGARSC